MNTEVIYILCPIYFYIRFTAFEAINTTVGEGTASSGQAAEHDSSVNFAGEHLAPYRVTNF